MKRPNDFNPNSFCIVKVQDWSETSPANAYLPSVTLNFLNIIDKDNLLVKNSKQKFGVFDNQQIKLTKNGIVSITEHSQQRSE